MRTDVVIGVIVSAAIHGGVFFGGVLFPNHPLVKVVQEKAPTIAVEMPKIEPDEPPEIVKTDEEVKPIEFAPPSQVDVPQVVASTDFVQKLQPPMPENITPAPGLVAIPEHRTPPGLGGAPIFDPSSLDQQPVARVRTPPQYPFEAKRTGLTGDVLVDFIVDANGDVQNAYALRSSDRSFEPAAVQAVSKWKFKPGRKGGRFVNTHMQVPIVFNLQDE